MKNYPIFKINITKKIKFTDPITLEDMSETVEEYIHKDINNIVILYDSNGSGENQYFFTNRNGSITKAWIDDANNFYGCKDVSDRIHLDNTNLDKSDSYLSLRSIGMHINHNYCLIDNVVMVYDDDDVEFHDKNYKNQLYVLYNLDKGFKSYASLATVNAGVAQRNALHCQDGYESKTSILLNAQPATTDYVQNLNEPKQDILVNCESIQIGPFIGTPPSEPNNSPPYEPNSPDYPPPPLEEPNLPNYPPPPLEESSSMDVQTGGRKTKKRKSIKYKNRKKRGTRKHKK